MAIARYYLQRGFTVGAIALTAFLVVRVPASSTTTTPTAPQQQVQMVDVLSPGSWYLYSEDKEAADYKTTSATGFVATVKRASVPNYNIQVGHNIEHALPEGAPLSVKFEARSPESTMVVATIEQQRAPYFRAMNEHVHLTPEWKSYDFICFVPKYESGEAALRFMIGEHAARVEVRHVKVELLPDAAFGGGSDLLSDKQINSRINRFRKGDLKIRVVDSASNPVPAAQVHIQQTRHQFMFGCNAFGLKPDDESPAQLAYQKAFLKLFNYATLPLYWNSFEREQGHQDYEHVDKMVKWCLGHNVTVKGHPLVWHRSYPEWAPQEPDQTIPLLHQRVTDLISHFKGKIDIWDVINEPSAAANYHDGNGESAWVRRDGAAKVSEKVLDWAHEAGGTQPETFIVNDYQTNSQFLTLLSSLEQDKQLPSAIGIQSHMHQGRWPLQQVWTTCDEFSQFNLPLHFTESTVLSGPERDIDWANPPSDWQTTTEGEKEQSDYVEQFYRVLFSHPAVQAITWWDLSDKGSWLNAPGGLLRKDMTPKPAYHRLYELIHEQWWSDLESQTDTNGSCRARVFYGDYTLTVTGAGGRHVTINTKVESSQPDKAVTISL